MSPKPGAVVSLGQVEAGPAYGFDGDRHKGGVILAQALAWNVGTCRHNAKGKAREEGLPGWKYWWVAQGRISP